MGQHKYNPNCELAKKGLLPPKPKYPSTAERMRLLEKDGPSAVYSAILAAELISLQSPSYVKK